MRGDFFVTRALLGIAGVVLAFWGLTSFSGNCRTDVPVPTLVGQGPSLPPAIVTSDEPGWEEELLAPDIQAFWLERRLLIGALSDRYRTEADSHRGASIRQEVEQLIRLSEREVYVMRLQNARSAGYDVLAGRLEQVIAQLPEKSTEDSSLIR